MTDNPNPLPLTIISGYLGAGKTTLVNHLLRHAEGRRLVVLVNDFGELPIDADLIESQDGNTLNLANGCACCSMGGDLFNALVEVLERSPRPDHLLIEASGVADPVRIANIARAEPDLVLDATLSLVDAENIKDLINDSQIGETVHHQLVSSDLILLNKLDLVEKTERIDLAKQLDEIAPNVQIIETEYSRIPINMAIGSKYPDSTKKTEQFLNDDHGEPYVKWSKMSEIPLDRSRLENALGIIGNKILRLKGIVFFADSNEPYIVQCVGARWSITKSTRPAIHKQSHSRLVAIGLKVKIDRRELDNIFTELS